MTTTILALIILLPLLAVLGFYVIYKLITQEIEECDPEEDPVVGDCPNVPEQLKDSD
tara:strand:- start:2283 stop:2453 length:171 start_codon:yes stop_codon:yes gene_type:complete